MGDLSATSQSMACCWFQWCRTPKPLPYAVTQDRAVLFVYTMGCPGFRLGINKFDRHKVCCCCSPSDPSPSQPAEVIARTAPSCALCSFMTVPILGWHLTMLPYLICGTQVMLGDMQEDVINKWRRPLMQKGVTISAGMTTQHDKSTIYIAMEKTDSKGDCSSDMKLLS